MSTQPLKVMTVFGTRPEAIKMAPVIQALRRDTRFQTVVTVTGQHRELLDQALADFGIVPDHDLNIMEHGQTLTDITVRCLRGLEPVLEAEKPEVVLVHGDTLTAFAASLAAFYRQIPVGHVEAGLRTGNPYNPFPEEMSRRLVATIAELHFAPTTAAKENLLRENVPADAIFVVGNTVIDALLGQVRPDYEFTDPILRQVDFTNRRVLLVTTHRRENLGEPLGRIYKALRAIADRVPDVEVVFAVHKNPAVRRRAEEILGNHPRIHRIEPPSYTAFANLMARSYLILTDSGGMQEEAPALGRPVLVLRETTERPEGIQAGTCLLVGTQSEAIQAAAIELLTDTLRYAAMAQARNPYGDGQAGRRIVDALAYRFGYADKRPDDFGLVNRR